MQKLEDLASAMCDVDSDSSAMTMAQVRALMTELKLSNTDISPLRPHTDDRTLAILLNR